MVFQMLSVVKQMEQMSISFKGVFCSSVFILRSIPLIMQTTFCKGVSFDPLSVSQYRFSAPKVDVSRCQVIQAFMVTLVVVVIDERLNLLFKITR